MKKNWFFSNILVIMILALTACGQGEEDNKSRTTDQSTESIGEAEQSTEDISETDVIEESTVNPPSEGELPTEDDIQEARKAAENYYAGTVFEVISMKVKSLAAGEVIFTVHARKEGVAVDPDRSITLRQTDGNWQVENEGY